jgi:hypothetical protein
MRTPAGDVVSLRRRQEERHVRTQGVCRMANRASLRAVQFPPPQLKVSTAQRAVAHGVEQQDESVVAIRRDRALRPSQLTRLAGLPQRFERRMRISIQTGNPTMQIRGPPDGVVIGRRMSEERPGPERGDQFPASGSQLLLECALILWRDQDVHIRTSTA